MSPECDRFQHWLDEAPNLTPAGAMAAHAAACETCRRLLAIETGLRRLGGDAAVAPARRAALVERIAPARKRQARPLVRMLRWSWPVAAAAAVVVAVVLLWPAPARHAPVSVTEIFGDLLGPLAEAKAPEVSVPAPGATLETAVSDTAVDLLGLNDVFAAVWGDLEGPLTIALDAMEAPRAAAAVRPSAKAPGMKSDRTIKEN